jgi:hypothetical protein
MIACMRFELTKMTLVLAFARKVLQAQVADVTGQWRVVRQENGTSSSQFEDWLRALPGAVFTLTHSTIPPLAMIRKDLGYSYFPSLPTITILQGQPDKPYAWGFLQPQPSGKFEGELAFSVASVTRHELSQLSLGFPALAPGGCWTHLSLEESEDGSLLSGTARINTKISTRDCRSSLAKEVRKGAPFKYTLIRLK